MRAGSRSQGRARRGPQAEGSSEVESPRHGSRRVPSFGAERSESPRRLCALPRIRPSRWYSQEAPPAPAAEASGEVGSLPRSVHAAGQERTRGMRPTSLRLLMRSFERRCKRENSHHRLGTRVRDRVARSCDTSARLQIKSTKGAIRTRDGYYVSGASCDRSQSGSRVACSEAVTAVPLRGTLALRPLPFRCIAVEMAAEVGRASMPA